MPFSIATLGYSFLGGFLPALVWLYFLLQEDSRCPEPKHMIVLALFAGMLAVPLVLPVEHLAIIMLPATEPAPGALVITAWAAIEEIAKYALAAIIVLWRRWVNESVDLVVYMITVALGFAAVENMLFLVQPLAHGHLAAGIATENLRFIGSTLVHVISSSAIGFALAFSLKLNRTMRTLFAAIGLILAIGLHAVFNFLIIMRDGAHTLTAFSIVWSGAVIFLALFEILKYFRYRHLPKNTC
ncbi:MAG: PrsW family intramembrane metalloprotease [Bacillota bacterium]